MSIREKPSNEEIAFLNARIDRLPVWSLSSSVFFVMAVIWFAVGWDITNIGVSLLPMERALHFTTNQSAIPVTANLLAYMIGAYSLGTLSDYVGRRIAITVTIILLIVGAILCVFSWDLASLTVFRFISGLGMGALLSLATAFTTEFSPAKQRGRNIALNVIWLGLGLAAPMFLMLFLLNISGGWRIIFLVGAIPIVTLPFLRDRWFPESPRWLIIHGHGERAEAIVNRMEHTAQQKTGEDLPPVPSVPAELAVSQFPTKTLFGKKFIVRTITIFFFWLLWYVWIYAFLIYEPTLLSKMGIALPSGLLFTGLSYLAFPIGALISASFADKIQRKYTIGGSTLILVAGLVVLATSSSPIITIVGSSIVAMAYFSALGQALVYTAEIFPTRARASALSVGDGWGHLGGAIQPFIVLAILASAGAASVFWFMAGVAFVCLLIILLLGIRTKGEGLTELAS